MTGVDVSQLQGVSFVMNQKACVGIRDRTRKNPRCEVSEERCNGCTQTDAKRTCAVSMLQSSLPAATAGTLLKSNRVLKEMKSDLVELRVHRDGKLAVVVWSDAARANRKDLSSTLGFFFRSHDNANLARWKTWCDTDSSPFWKIETKSKLEFERGGAANG